MTINSARNPWSEAFAREHYDLDHRRSALPLLRNLGADTPDSIAMRIAERAQMCYRTRA